MQQLRFPAVRTKVELRRYSIPGVLRGRTSLLGCFHSKMDLEIQQLDPYGLAVQHLEQDGQFTRVKLISS